MENPKFEILKAIATYSVKTRLIAVAFLGGTGILADKYPYMTCQLLICFFWIHHHRFIVRRGKVNELGIMMTFTKQIYFSRRGCFETVYQATTPITWPDLVSVLWESIMHGENVVSADSRQIKHPLPIEHQKRSTNFLPPVISNFYHLFHRQWLGCICAWICVLVGLRCGSAVTWSTVWAAPSLPCSRAPPPPP